MNKVALGSARDVRCILSSVTGKPETLGQRTAMVSRADEFGFVTHGPYELLRPGRYRAEFRIALRDVPVARLGDFICAMIDVVADSGNSLLAKRQIRKTELAEEFRTFALEFMLTEPRAVEYRTLVNAQASIATDVDVTVIELPAQRRTIAPPGSAEREWDNEADFLDGYLRNVSGVIHIGANKGQERKLYEVIGLDVIWVEALEQPYNILVDKIARYPRQRAVRALITDEKDRTYDFNVANHDGCSSIFDYKGANSALISDTKYIGVERIIGTTFANLVETYGIDLKDYEALTLDVEGAEALVLRGAGDLLSKFRYIKCEVSDCPSRKGAPTSDDLDDILGPFGFEQLARRAFAYGPDRNGTFWDIIWKKRIDGQPLHRPDVSLPFISNDKPGWDWKMMDLE